MGKLLSTNTRFYFNGVDPGLHGSRFTVTLEGAVLDPTAIVDNAERVHPGERMDSFDYAGFFDDDTGSSTLGLEAISGTSVGDGSQQLMVLVGTGTGSVAYAGTGYWLAHKPVANIRDLVRVEGTWAMDKQWSRGKHTGVKRTATAGTNSGTIDDGAATTAGGTFYVQVFEVTAGTLTFNLEHSTDGTTWANKLAPTFTGRGDLATAFTGSLHRYVRTSSGITAGTSSYAGAYVRD